MNKKNCLLLFLVALFALSNVFAQHRNVIDGHKKQFKKHDSINSTQVDFFLTLSDGVRLDCTKFIPTGSPPSGGWPCIVICHGYGLTKYDDMDEAIEFADNGYYSMVYSMRGQGISEGVSNLISRIEMNDLMQVVQYVKNDANTNDNLVGVKGGSQGGILPFMAICNGMNVKTIISDLSSPEFASSWIENNCVKMTLLWSVSYTPDIVRYNSQVGSYRSWILSKNKDKWDSLAYYMPLNRDFMSQVSSCQIPIYMQGAWQDKFFNPLGLIRSFYLLPYNNIKAYLGAMDGHGSDYVQDEIDYQSTVEGEWWDYWMRGIQNGVMDATEKFTHASNRFPIQYLSDDSIWTWQRSVSSVWPPAGYQDVRLYFQPGGQLLNTPYTGTTTSIDLANSITDTTLSMLEAANYEFTGSVFTGKFHKQKLIFDTPVLQQNATMNGTPQVELYYQSNADACQYNYQVWEIKASGEQKLVTRANYTDRNNTPNSSREKYFYGSSNSHIFQAGSRIRVILTNLDNIEAGNFYREKFLRTNPFVLPVLKPAVNKMMINNATNSYILLPLQNFVIGIHNISSEVPKDYALYQNYPNPFNPSTKIKFEVPSGKNSIQLKIFDVTGKEVATLVNESLKPGTYEADWNASGFASGVYFYKLVSGNFVNVKKMVLMK